MNYYNEYDPKAAAWLRELIVAGEIPNGIVDERSITEVRATDLVRYTQCHFFAGIGGWSLALKLSGWPADRPVWTGSCPCQPFSAAGKGLGEADERHLWPFFFRLIRDCRKAGQQWAFTVFGEQVANAIGKGWLDGISTDLESEGYACGSAVLGAHSVGAPHMRQRLYWVADTPSKRLERTTGQVLQGNGGRLVGSCETRAVEQSNCGGLSFSKEQHRKQEISSSNGSSCREHLDRLGGHLWSDYELVQCRDNKARRVPTESAFFPLAHGIPARVVRLRGYGNAIVPQVAAEFIQAFMSI